MLNMKAFIAAFVLIGGLASGAVFALTPQLSASVGTVVTSANTLPVGQVAVNVNGSTAAYPLPAGRNAVSPGEKITVWAYPNGAPATPQPGPADPLVLRLGVVVLFAALISALLAAAVQLGIDEARRRDDPLLNYA